ncbi:MAG TPA: histidine phosphatase family protein [Dehalococcoidia bacterium]
MRLVLVRHGETEHNRRQVSLGRADVRLNERGIAQAKALAASFDAAPDAVYASPLSRARDTAAAIAGRWGVAATPDDGLIEMDVGEMEHLTSGELRERYPEFLKGWMSADRGDITMPGGSESLRGVQHRAWASLERIAATPAGTVVIVTHNFVILTAVCRALNLPLAESTRIRIALAGKSVIDITKDFASLLQLNDVSHLLAAGLADDLRAREARA